MSIFTQEQLEQIRSIVREELAAAAPPTRFFLEGAPITAEDVKRAMDKARDSVAKELQARQ